MHSLLLLLDASPHVDRMDAEWEETEDYFYEVAADESTSAPPRRLRTRVESHSASLLRPSETVHKTRLDDLVLCSHIVDMRVSLCREEAIATTSLPPVVHPDLVRLKHVRRFRPATASGGIGGRSPFVVTCALAWQGKDASDAEVRQRTHDPLYEIECELDCHGPTPTRMRSDPSTVAASLLQKATDLMLPPLHGVVLHAPTSSSSVTSHHPRPTPLAPRSPPSLPSPRPSDRGEGGRPKRPRGGGGERG